MVFFLSSFDFNLTTTECTERLYKAGNLGWGKHFAKEGRPDGRTTEHLNWMQRVVLRRIMVSMMMIHSALLGRLAVLDTT